MIAKGAHWFLKNLIDSFSLPQKDFLISYLLITPERNALGRLSCSILLKCDEFFSQSIFGFHVVKAENTE